MNKAIYDEEDSEPPNIMIEAWISNKLGIYDSNYIRRMKEIEKEKILT